MLLAASRERPQAVAGEIEAPCNGQREDARGLTTERVEPLSDGMVGFGPDEGLRLRALSPSRGVHVATADILPVLPGFHVRAVIGSGGMGTVYDATEQRTGRRVALKTFSRRSASSVYRLKQEFRAVARIRHPNVGRVLGLRSAGTRPFLVMEYIEGRDLMRAIRGAADPAARLERARALIPQLIRGVLALHGEGVLHRDIKPQNVLVDREDRVCVIDFGLVSSESRSIAEARSRSAVVGTPAYVAPEVITGVPATRASDAYSIGVLIFHCLEGRIPFSGAVLEQMRAKIDRDPPDLTVGAGTPWAEVCRGLMERDPARRMTLPEALRRLVPGGAAEDGPVTMFLGNGNEREASELRRCLTDCIRSGSPAAAHLWGEPGLGKSDALAAFALDAAASHDALVLNTRCLTGDGVTLRAVDGLVESLLLLAGDGLEGALSVLSPQERGEIFQCFPALDVAGVVGELHHHAPSPDELGRIATTLGLVLRAVAGCRAVVITVDDAQRIDTSSQAVFAELLLRLRTMPLLVASASTSAAPVVSVSANQWVIPMARSGPAAVAHAIDTFQTEATRALTPDLAAIAQGNVPFVRAVLELEGGCARQPLRARTLVDAVVGWRLRSLPSAARQLAGAAARFPTEVSIAQALRAAGLDDRHAVLSTLLAEAGLALVDQAHGTVRVPAQAVRSALLGYVDGGRTLGRG